METYCVSGAMWLGRQDVEDGALTGGATTPGQTPGTPPAPRTTVCSQHVIKETMCRICLKFTLDNLEKIQDPDNFLILKPLPAGAEML